MNVYVLMNRIDCEGENLVGVFPSLEDARNAKNKMEEWEQHDSWAIWELELGQKVDCLKDDPILEGNWY